MTNLSDHFTLEELTKSDTAKRMGIENKPSDEHLAHMTSFLVPGLEECRDILDEPLHLTNAYRNPKVNKAVGGTPTSAHPQGYAADFFTKGRDCFEVYRVLREAVFSDELKIDQLILESSRNIVHVSFDPRFRSMCGHQPGAAGTKIDWTYK